MKIDYVELPAHDMSVMKAFYSAAFGWSFEDWGPDYAAFVDAGLDGGFYRTETTPPRGGALVILYADDLESAETKVLESGGTLIDRLEFPGGRRFHFLDPTGNELAAWTKAEPPAP